MLYLYARRKAHTNRAGKDTSIEDSKIDSGSLDNEVSWFVQKNNL